MRLEEQAPPDWGRPDEWLPPGVKAFTPSMVGQFMKCGVQFYRRWYQGEIVPPGVAAKRGTAVHAAAEHNHRQKIKSRTDLPLDHLQDVARDTFRRKVENEETFFAPEELERGKQIVLTEALDQSTRLAKCYGTDLAPKIMPTFIEQRLLLNVPGLPVKISGQIDVGVELLQNGTTWLWLLDLKTSTKSKNQDDADGSLQLTTYDLLGKQVLEMPNVVLTLETLVALKNSEKLQSLPTTRRPEDHTVLLNRYAGVLRACREQVFLPADPSNWWCSAKWCGFFATCQFIPAYRR